MKNTADNTSRSFRDAAGSIKLSPSAEYLQAKADAAAAAAERKAFAARQQELAAAAKASETTRQLIRRLTWKNTTAELFGRWSWLSQPFVKQPRVHLSAERLAKLGAFPAEIKADMVRLVGNVDALNNAFANASRYESIHALLVELRGNLEAVAQCRIPSGQG